MSMLKNAYKSQRPRRERHQPEARSSYGLLEKKKDYQARARDYNQKKEALLTLNKKALNKNPDEFYHHMINSKQVDGVHKEKSKDNQLTIEQIRLMQTQDKKYIESKRTSEKNKIEKLRATLHLINSNKKTKNTHTFFVDSEKEKKRFDVANRLQSHPALLNRTHNRPRLEDIKSGAFRVDEDELDPKKLEKLSKYSGGQYKLLYQRIEREKQLGIIQSKMEMKQALQGAVKPARNVVKEEKGVAPVFLWKQERKK